MLACRRAREASLGGASVAARIRAFLGGSPANACAPSRDLVFAKDRRQSRPASERALGGDIGDWADQGFLSSNPGPCDEELAAIVSAIEQSSRSAAGSAEDLRHVLFVAAAGALLPGGCPFYFYAMDPEEALRVNCCDVVRANRVTARVLGAQ